jgi:hypothetical protein
VAWIAGVDCFRGLVVLSGELRIAILLSGFYHDFHIHSFFTFSILQQDPERDIPSVPVSARGVGATHNPKSCHGSRIWRAKRDNIGSI